MPIEIVDSPEPLSELSLQRRGPDAEPLLVESNASRVLRQELERYCEGKINGRSFLIAGHRGAGKTTLVAKAFYDVKRESDGGASMLRPLFIPLHGPSLFPDPAALPTSGPQDKTGSPAAAAAANPAAKGEAKGEAKTERKSDAQIALEQITLGLHRAVSREFAAQYHARAQQLAYLLRTPNQARAALRSLRSSQATPGQAVPAAGAESIDTLPDEAELDALIESLPSERELFELAGQFEAELYEGPAPERLRDYWERVHALSGGVLFPGGFAPLVSGITGYPTPPTPAGLFPNLIEVHAQGIRELVALSGVLEAYRRISGDYKRSEGQKDSQQDTTERTTGFNASAKELAAPIASLLTGGLATTGLAISGATPLSTALGGIVTALGASLVFKVNTTRKRERSLSREYQFIYDLSVATLDRILPILIERLREAGLAPVFVVDELDKVDDLSTRIISMVHHLKKLVAENAFFCFLTNRSYFEEMLAQGSGRAYPVEYTYYTHRLFVVFAPEDFERYLLQRLPEPLTPNVQMNAVQSAVQVAPETADLTACAILRWALRHRSQLHVVDLQREIAALRDDEGRVRAAPEDIISARRNIIDVTFQVAIESTLGQRDVIQVMQYRPEFRRLLHDAMYYVSRHWLAGAEDVDLSEDGRDDFLAYLESRTGRDEERRSGANGNAADDARPSVTANDLDFLFDQVRIMADFLCDRPSVEVVVGDASGTTRDWRNERLAAWGETRSKRDLPDVEPDVLDALLVGDRSSLLVRIPDHPLVYRFRHRVAGTTGAAQPSAVPPRKRPAAARPSRAAAKAPPAKLEVEPPMAAAVEEKSPAPAAAAPPVVQTTAWEPKARFIEQFANALHAVTLTDTTTARPSGSSRPRVSTITLDTLATRFRVIPSSPTASVVLQGIANLRDAASRGSTHAGYADDVFAVEQFYQILQRNGEQIARAIVLGAAIGRSCPETTPDARISAGLAVIARALQFANKREDEVGRSLENVSAMVRTEFGASFEEPLNRLGDDWADVDAFSKRTRAALEIVNSFPPPVPDADVDRAWDSVQHRLNHWVQTSEVLDPDVSELLAAAARRGPTELLEFDPREMTLSQWTRTLLATRRPFSYAGTPPPVPDLSWLTFYVWHALGFRTNDQRENERVADWAGVGNEFRSAGASGNWTYQLQRAHKAIQDRILLNTADPPNSALIMLRRTKSPMTAAWRPVADAAVLLVTAEELSAFTQNAAGLPFELPINLDKLCAIEMEPELATQLYSAQLPAIGNLLKGGWVIYVYPADRGREMKMPNIVAPPDARAVIDAGTQGRTPIPDRPV